MKPKKTLAFKWKYLFKKVIFNLGEKMMDCNFSEINRVAFAWLSDGQADTISFL